MFRNSSEIVNLLDLAWVTPAKRRFSSASRIYNVLLIQGGPIFFLPRAKNTSPAGPKVQETSPGTFQN